MYSEDQLEGWQATPERPVKVINYLLISYVEPAVSIDELRTMDVIKGHPQQSIYKLSHDLIDDLVERAGLEFDV